LPAIFAKLDHAELEKLFNVKDVSDTYLMSIMVRLFSHRILKFYTSSRWAVFTIESGSPQIFLYGDFQKYKEFYVSNMSWQQPVYSYSYSYSYPYLGSSKSSKKGGKKNYLYPEYYWSVDFEEDEYLKDPEEEEWEKEINFMYKKWDF
jgi:hypothetical protein